MEKISAQKKQRHSRLFIILSLPLLIGFLSFLGFRTDKQAERIPDYLEGTWSTTASHYEDRFLIIDEMVLIFTTGERSNSEYYISKTIKTVEADSETFLIDCTNPDGDEYQFSIVYRPENGGIVHFQKQPEVEWTKDLL